MNMELISLGITDDATEQSYKYIPFESRGIAISATTRSGKSTLIFQLKKRFKKCIFKPQIISIARDKDEFRQRDEIPFVIVGKNGEIPMDTKLGKQVGENVRKSGLDVIVYVNSLLTEKEQDEFIADFIIGIQMDDDERFWKKPCVVFIDEVQILCYSGSTKFPRCKDAIVYLATTCLKKNILPIVASHAMKDFYINARNEFSNHIVGFLDNPDQRKFACELLDIENSQAQTIKDFRNGKGRFYVEGSDICNDAVIIQVKADKIYPKGEVVIPKLDLETLLQADELRRSIKLTDKVSIETQLRFELAAAQNMIDRLSQNQASPENLERIKRDGEDIGWNMAMNSAYHIFQNAEHGLLGVRKTKDVELVKGRNGRYMVVLK